MHGRMSVVAQGVMDPSWVADANTAYDTVTQDDEQVLEAVAGIGGPTNVFVTRGELLEGKLNAGLPTDDAVCSPRLRGGNRTCSR
jgi:hypothetical protein